MTLAQMKYKKFGFLFLKSDELKLIWDILSEFPTLLNIEEALTFLFRVHMKTVFDVLPKDLLNDKI